MSFWISFLNDFAVSIFGSVLSASFCDALATPTQPADLCVLRGVSGIFAVSFRQRAGADPA